MNRKEILIWALLAIGSGLGAIAVSVASDVASVYTMKYLNLTDKD